MSLQRLNTIQIDGETKYTDIYLKQALANLGQRFSAKGDGIKTGSFTIMDMLNLDDKSKITNDDFIYITKIKDTYYCLKNSDTKAADNSNVVTTFSINNSVISNLENETDMIEVMQNSIDIKFYKKYYITFDNNKYFFIGLGYKSPTYNIPEILYCCEFDNKTDYKAILLTNNEIKISTTDEDNIVKYNLNNPVNVQNIYNELLIDTNKLNINDITDTLMELVKGNTIETIQTNLFVYYKNVFNTYIRDTYNYKRYYDGSSFVKLQRSIIAKLIDKLEVKGIAVKPNYKFNIIQNDNSSIYYYSYSFIVMFSKYTEKTKYNNTIIADITGTEIHEHNEEYMFLIDYFKDTRYDYDKYIQYIYCGRLNIFPYINKQTTEYKDKDVWYINGEETNIPATGDKAGNPNIMLVSYTKNPPQKITNSDNSDVNIKLLHSYYNNELNDITTLTALENLFVNGKKYEFNYVLDKTPVNNSEYTVYKFSINLPTIESISEREVIKNIFDNSLVMAIVDINCNKDLQEKLYGVVNNNVSEDLENEKVKVFTPDKSSYITVFCHLATDDNLNVDWKIIANPALSNNQNTEIALDMGSMLSVDALVKSYVDATINPDTFEHRWLVFKQSNASEKQTAQVINGAQIERKTIYPVLKSDGANYYGEDYYNDLNMVPKFLPSEAIIKNGQRIANIEDNKNFGDKKLFSIKNNKIIHNFQVGNDYIPNKKPDDTKNNVYPILDFKEVLGNNLTALNRISIISVDKDNTVRHAYIGVDGSKNGEKDVLVIGTDGTDYNMQSNNTVTDNWKGFGKFSKIRFNIPLEQAGNLYNENITLYKIDDNHYSTIVTVPKNGNVFEYSKNIVSKYLDTTKTVYTTKLCIGAYLKQKFGIVGNTNLTIDASSLVDSYYLVLCIFKNANNGSLALVQATEIKTLDSDYMNITNQI